MSDLEKLTREMRDKELSYEKESSELSQKIWAFLEEQNPDFMFLPVYRAAIDRLNYRLSKIRTIS